MTTLPPDLPPEHNTLPTEKADPSRVVARVKSICTLTQSGGSFLVIGQPQAPPFRAKLTATLRAENVSESSIHVVGDFVFVGLNRGVPQSYEGEAAGPPKEDPFVEITARFVVIYELDAGDVPSKVEAQSFAESNGTFNIHPYWREYVRECLGRAGLPAYQIPVINPLRGTSLEHKIGAPQ